ncbi:MAG: type II toxin-antitoxin system HicB family antitoxin [bacterium]|nr:type II toxin-antitoxin system HicB family antitoxin [bacterium]
MAVSYVNLPVSIFREGKHFIAHTPSLDLATAGKTFEEAEKRFAEIVEIFFEELSRMGTTDEVLNTLGWQKVKAKWSPPVEVSHKLESFRIPQAL